MVFAVAALVLSIVVVYMLAHQNAIGELKTENTLTAMISVFSWLLTSAANIGTAAVIRRSLAMAEDREEERSHAGGMGTLSTMIIQTCSH